jgi:hypothetical protein
MPIRFLLFILRVNAMPLSRYEKVNRPSFNLAIGSSGGLAFVVKNLFLSP